MRIRFEHASQRLDELRGLRLLYDVGYEDEWSRITNGNQCIRSLSEEVLCVPSWAMCRSD